MTSPIVCVGEVLWDALPAGLFLGGAPYNVAYHLRRLGEPVTLVSRVGDDRLGREALRRLRAQGFNTDSVQVDSVLPTGFVRVEVDETGSPEYEIVQPVAWDAITLDEAVRDRAVAARAVVFGSLAQRGAVSRHTVQMLGALGAVAVFDVNLRPPHVDPEVVRASLAAADFVKLNAAELQTLSRWFGWADAPRAAVDALADTFGSRLVCVTRGADGAALWHAGRWLEHPGYPVEVRDTVGAGDAFLAALLAGVLNEHSDAASLDAACRLGSYVATRSGATPFYEVSRFAEIAALPLV